MKKYASLWFGIGFAVLLLLAATSPSVYVPWTAIRGTNEVLVTTNPATGKIIIGPATPISTQINAAQVWTNAASYYREANGNTNFTFATRSAVSFPYFSIGDPAVHNYIRLQGNGAADAGESLNFRTGDTVGQFYGYEDPTSSSEGFVVFYMSGSLNDGVLLDPGQDFGQQPFLFRSFRTVAATDPVWTLNNSNALILTVTGEGGIQTPTFTTTSSHTTNATPLDVNGLLSAYNGVATLLHNTSTNTLITVGSSPFNFTNTASQTIVLYLDANGATTTAALNGQTIFKSLVAGDHTIILKPSAYTTVTYSLAVPIMTWTEL